MRKIFFPPDTYGDSIIIDLTLCKFVIQEVYEHFLILRSVFMLAISYTCICCMLIDTFYALSLTLSFGDIPHS